MNIDSYTKAVQSKPSFSHIGRAMQMAGTWCVIGLLATFPLWRHRVLYHRQPEAVFFEFHDIIFYTSDLLLVGGPLLWLAGRRLDIHRQRLRRGLLIWPQVALVALALIGIPWAVDPVVSIYLTIRLILLLALYLTLLNLAARPEVVAAALALGALVQAAVGVPQFLLGRSVGLPEMLELPLNGAQAGTSVVLANGERWLRAHGTTQHPNLLGGCLAVLLLLLVGYELSEHRRFRRPLMIAAGFGLVALLATFSRAAWLGLAAGAVVMVLLLRPWLREGAGRWQSVVSLGIGALIIIALFVGGYRPLVASRLGFGDAGTEVRSIEERASLVGGAQALIRQRPVVGVGLGNFSTALYQLVPQAVADYPEYQPVHLVPLLVLAELGPLGPLVWLSLAAGPLAILAGGRHRRTVSPQLAASTGAIVVLLIVGMFDAYPWASHQGRVLGWVVLGLWAREWLLCQTEVQL